MEATHIESKETSSIKLARVARPRLQKSYCYAALGFMGLVVIQVFLIGMGVLVDGNWLNFHKLFGTIIIWLPLLVLVPLSLFARLPRRLCWLTGLLALLAILQPILIWPMRLLGLPDLAALHAVNALAVFFLPIYLSYRAWLPRQNEHPL